MSTFAKSINKQQSTTKKIFKHKVDTELQKYCKEINQCAFVAFACIIFVNVIYFFIYGVGLRRWIIFPICEYFIFDISLSYNTISSNHEYLSLGLWTINWTLLICVIFTQVRLQEMHINSLSIIKAIAMFLCLNVFGTINSILIMYPIVTILNYTYYYKFKSRM